MLHKAAQVEEAPQLQTAAPQLTHWTCRCPVALHTLPSLNPTRLRTQTRVKDLIPFAQCREHIPACVAVLGSAHSSLCCSITAPSESSHLPTSLPPPGGAYRGPPQTGEPPQRIGLGHGVRPLPCSPPAPGRGVGDEQPQRRRDNLHCSVRAHRGRRTPARDRNDADNDGADGDGGVSLT